MNTSEVIICPNCKGYGTIEKSELIDYHNNDYKYWDVECVNCDGLGRLFEKTTIITEKLIPKTIEPPRPLKIRGKKNES